MSAGGISEFTDKLIFLKITLLLITDQNIQYNGWKVEAVYATFQS
jgi:hypothetical protein